MAIIDNVLLNTEDVLVIGGPSSITLSLDFGKQGSRGTKIFADDSTPTSYFSSEVNQSLDIQLYDMFLNTLTNDLYQYVNTPESYSWQLIGNLAGDPGPKGDTGSAGPAGQGLTAGGTAGQILVKLSATNYDTAWIDNYATSTKHLVKNNTGATMPKGSVVYISGATGTNMLVSLADADTEMTSSRTVGFLETNLDQGDEGYVVTSGLLAGLNTNGAAAAGQSIWLSSTAGQFVYGSPPAEPAHSVYLGVVTRKQSVNGEIFIHVSNGLELDEIHGVLVPSPVANDLLYYASDGLWKNSTIAALGIVKTGSTTNKVANNMLDNSAITIGSTSTSLGATSASLAGLTDVTATGTVQGGSVTATGTVQGATVTSTGTVNSTNLRATSTDGATLGTTAIITGNPAGQHIGISGASIVSMSDASTASTLFLQPNADSTITMGDATSTINILGTLSNGNRIAAGTATAGTAPLRFTSGTNLTTPVSGVIEYDGKSFYSTQEAASRMLIPSQHRYMLTATRTLSNGTGAQSLFGAGFRVAADTSYDFEMLVALSCTGTTSHTVSLGFALSNVALTATTGISYNVFYTQNATSLATITPTITKGAWITTNNATVITDATTVVAHRVISVRGTIRVNTSTSNTGTITPQLTYSAAPGAAPTVAANSWIRVTPAGNQTELSTGVWA